MFIEGVHNEISGLTGTPIIGKELVQVYNHGKISVDFLKIETNC